MNESFYIDYLQIKLRWLREMRKPATYSFVNMQFPYTLIWLVLDGTLDLSVAGKRFTAVTGDLLIFRPDTSLTLFPGAQDNSIHYLSMYADLKIGSMDLTSLYKLPFATKPESTADLQQCVAVWREAVETFNHLGSIVAAKPEHHHNDSPLSFQFHTDVSLQFMALQAGVYRLLYQFLRLMRAYLPSGPLLFDSRVMKACDYIKQHLHEAITLERLAKQVHLSIGHLSHLFIKTFAIAPMEYVLNVRMQTAKELLMNSSYSIKHISEMLGFPEQSQFSRTFRREEGVSPSHYRKAVALSLTREL